MDNMLDDLAYGISEESSELFDSVYAGFEKNASVTADEQERILSSVMGKAGFDMKENISIKKTGKISKRAAIMVIAAAMLLIGSVTAAAYYAGYRLEGGQIIREFYGENAETWFDSNGLNDKQAEQNSHFDVSMYSFISDGNYFNSVWCIEALDESAKKELENDGHCNIQAYYADTGEKINMAGSSTWWNESLNDDAHHYISHKMSLYDVDISRDIEYRIDYRLITLDSIVYDTELTDGLKFVVNASPNVETKIVANENGTEFLLSPLGVSQKFRGEEYPYEIKETLIKEFSLIKSDGSYEFPFGEGNCNYGTVGYDYSGIEGNDYKNEVMFQMAFDDIIDISDVVGIKIDDDIYMAVNE